MVCFCGYDCCKCQDACFCCRCCCICTDYLEMRKHDLCEHCGEPLARRGPEQSIPPPPPMVYPGVRFDRLPDLDFLSNNYAGSSGTSGHASRRSDSARDSFEAFSERRASETDEPLVFHMDDLDTSSGEGMETNSSEEITHVHRGQHIPSIIVSPPAESDLKLEHAPVMPSSSSTASCKCSESSPSKLSPPSHFSVSPNSSPLRLSVSEPSPSVVSGSSPHRHLYNLRSLGRMKISSSLPIDLSHAASDSE